LRSFAKDSNNVFNMIVLGQFATSTATLAMTMFQLTLVRTTTLCLVLLTISWAG
jgi:hypothetical protein